jgi:serine/threonine-protein kinase
VTAETPEIPATLDHGRYRVERVIGVGGTATVLLVTDTRIGVQKAVKLLLPRYARSERNRARFRTEAHAQAALKHPNVLMVHDAVEDEQGAYLVMELAERDSLATRVLASGSLSVAEVLQVGITIGGALAVAHAAGLVHRDIKPQNILVDRHGVLKLADFGIAHVEEREEQLTRAGDVMGTWDYMPPEQREGAAGVDRRADIYAFGVTLFALLTGRRVANLHNQEGWAAAYAGVPPGLALVLQRATRLFPEDRYPAMEAFVADLARVRDGQAPEAATAVAAPAAPRRAPAVALEPRGAAAPTTDSPPDTMNLSSLTGDTGAAAPAGAPAAAPPVARRGPPWAAALGLLLVLGGGAAGVIGWGGRAPAPPPAPAAPVEASPPVAAPPAGAAPPVAAAPAEAPPTPPAEAAAADAPEAPPAGRAPRPAAPDAAPAAPAGRRVITVMPTAPDGAAAPAAAAPAPADAGPTGTVQVRTIPSGATVRLGGRALDAGGGRGYTLPVGQHTLELVAPGGAESHRVAVSVRAGQTVDICYSFDTNAACGAAP